jgi:hypothetical protein
MPLTPQGTRVVVVAEVARKIRCEFRQRLMFTCTFPCNKLPTMLIQPGLDKNSNTDRKCDIWLVCQLLSL